MVRVFKRNITGEFKKNYLLKVVTLQNGTIIYPVFFYCLIITAKCQYFF